MRGARATNYNAVRPVVTLRRRMKEKKKNESRSLDRLPYVHFLCKKKNRFYFRSQSECGAAKCASIDWVTQAKKERKKSNNKVFNGINIRAVNDSFWSVRKELNGKLSKATYRQVRRTVELRSRSTVNYYSAARSKGHRVPIVEWCIDRISTNRLACDATKSFIKSIESVHSKISHSSIRAASNVSPAAPNWR